MIENAKRANPTGTYAVFVDPTAKVRTDLQMMLDPDHICVVSCPPVLQCGMLLRAMASKKSFP